MVEDAAKFSRGFIELCGVLIRKAAVVCRGQGERAAGVVWAGRFKGRYGGLRIMLSQMDSGTDRREFGGIQYGVERRLRGSFCSP